MSLPFIQTITEAFHLVSIFLSISMFVSFMYIRIRFPDLLYIRGLDVNRWLFGSGALYHVLLFSYALLYLQ